MTKVWDKKKKRWMYANKSWARQRIQSLARGYLGRLEAQRRRDEREIMNFVNYVPEPYTGDPNLQWLQGMAGAGGRPMAAGGGPVNTRDPPMRVRPPRGPPPGHPNMNIRNAQQIMRQAAFPANHHSGNLVSNPRRGWGNRLSATSMHDFLRRHGGPTARRDAEGRGVTYRDFLGNFPGGSN